MDELDIQLSTMSYLKVFEDDVDALAKKLFLRYKEKPKDDVRIVCNVTANICARLIIGTAPKNLWQPMVESIVHIMVEVIKKEKEEGE